MYIGQATEPRESKADGREGPAIDRRALVDYEIPVKIVRSANDRRANLDRGDDGPEKLEPIFQIANGKASHGKLMTSTMDHGNLETFGRSEKFLREEEKNREFREGGTTGNEESVADLRGDQEADNDEFFDDDDYDDDQEESALYGNKSPSIFIRRRTMDCEGEESVRKAKELQRPDKWIAERNGKRARKLRKKRALSFVDTLITLFVVAPLVIGQWRGIWGMMDIYKDYFPEWICFIVGTGLHLVFAVMRGQLHGRFVEKWSTHSCVGRFAYDSVRLTYIYIFCVACNAHWRGGWMIFIEYFGSDTATVSLYTILFTTALMLLRTFRNLLAPPFILVIDQPDRTFHFPTRYNVNTRDWTLYILDCAFSVGVVGSLVVFVWRGVWVLFDIHLFPENREYSAIGSLIIGYIIVAVTFCLQPLMRYTCARLEGLARLLAADAFLLLSFLGTVNVWRGIWSVLDLWLLPDDIEMSCWITHIGCFVFLVLLNCSNSILVRGVYIDAEEEEGRCVVFPCHYLRLFFKIERQKKEARRQNLAAASKEAQSRNEGNPKEAENETLINCTNTMPTLIPANPEPLV